MAFYDYSSTTTRAMKKIRACSPTDTIEKQRIRIETHTRLQCYSPTRQLNSQDREFYREKPCHLIKTEFKQGTRLTTARLYARQCLEGNFMNKQLLHLAPLSMSLIGFVICGSMVFADTIVETTRTTKVEPFPQSPLIIVRSANPDISTTRIEVTKEVPISSVTTTTEMLFPSRENFARRLELMKEQLDLGTSKGWIRPADTVMLAERYKNLLLRIDLANVHGLSCEQANRLERQLNEFNIDLSEKMSTASSGYLQ